MTDIRVLQHKILEIMKYIDNLCRKNGINYYIMGGTALGAVRHGGFIPWDDDLDIFMTYEEYMKFKLAFNEDNSDKFIIQEWRSVPEYLEYAKVRMNGTAFIEENLKNRKDLHHGIYVDIMILHKVPACKLSQVITYIESKFVTIYGLSQRGWKPNSKTKYIVLKLINLLPSYAISKIFYRNIYKHDGLVDNFRYCYWITKCNFNNGLFDVSCFMKPVDIIFEDLKLFAPSNIHDYLFRRYGDYMTIPNSESIKASSHATIWDVNNGYEKYIS